MRAVTTETARDFYPNPALGLVVACPEPGFCFSYETIAGAVGSDDATVSHTGGVSEYLAWYVPNGVPGLLLFRAGGAAQASPARRGLLPSPISTLSKQSWRCDVVATTRLRTQSGFLSKPHDSASMEERYEFWSQHSGACQ